MLAEEPHGPPPLAQTPSSEALEVCVVRVSVGETGTDGFGPMRFTTYRITSELEPGAWQVDAGVGGDGPAGPVSCRHRFSDFLRLREDLLDAFPGVIVPPLPEKQAVGAWRAAGLWHGPSDMSAVSHAGHRPAPLQGASTWSLSRSGAGPSRRSW